MRPCSGGAWRAEADRAKQQAAAKHWPETISIVLYTVLLSRLRRRQPVACNKKRAGGAAHGRAPRSHSKNRHEHAQNIDI